MSASMVHGPTAAAAHSDPGDALETLARQEYSLDSLVELSRRLWDTHDLHDAADGLLLSLMGQIGTTQAALWLSEDRLAGHPVLIRCQGMDPALARAIAVASWEPMSRRRAAAGLLASPSAIRAALGPSALSLAMEAGVALLAPLGAGDTRLGMVGLGWPADRPAYDPREVEMIEASLAIAGLALRTGQLHGRGARAMEGLDGSSATFEESPAGDPALRLEEAALGDFLARYHEQRRPSIAAWLRELHLEGTGTPRRARFDPRRLRQVLDALVDHAVHSSTLGGNISLRLSDVIDEDVTWRVVTVEDDGLGLAATRPPATLATVRKTIESMGGRLMVRSEEGKGSAFSVLLPVA